ncbi:lipoprotein [Spiroplasma endosymbiont of Panorpa germanica]|uniref:lipoprotein n=1 Tax=Spiroplasma endosymbiont of Panorpa germanica TaxID=3066314 RepID=UPI0030CEDFF4
MKKLLGLLAAFGLTASAGSVVVACGDTAKESAEVAAVIAKINEIAENSKTTPLADKAAAEAAVKGTATDKVSVEIKEKAEEANVTVKVTILKAEAVDSTREGEVETEEVTIYALVKDIVVEAKDLSKLTLDLEEIADKENATILAALKAKNSLSDEEVAEIEVSKASETGATITASKNAKLVSGSAEVTFTVAKGE